MANKKNVSPIDESMSVERNDNVENKPIMWVVEKSTRSLFNKDTNGKIHILQDELVDIQGIKFYGTPWCPSLRNWAFYGDKQHLLNRFNKIPDDVDVLITHCPPKYGLQGTVLETNWNYMNDFGCVELQQIIDERFTDKDMWILSGHIHSGKHEVEKMNNVKYRNCSIKNEDYEVAYQPFEFDLK